MTESKQSVHLITSVERRRRWHPEEKRTIVQETYLPNMSVSLVARKYAITPSQLFYWRRQMEEGALQGVQSARGVVPKERVLELEKRVRELERLLGKKTMENEILREAVDIAREKKLILRRPLHGVDGFQ